MKYCRQCGSQLNDEDKFCHKCGKACAEDMSAPIAAFSVNTPMIQQNNAFVIPDIPNPGPNEAELVVFCNSIYSGGNVTILNGTGNNVKIANGTKSVMKVAPGTMAIRYRVDRGPCLTLWAARKNDYSKSLVFHPGEIIIMQVNIGREINNTTFQSSMGYII